MNKLITTGLAVAALTALSACGGSEDRPEPEGETVAAEMPQTPDMGAASDAAAAANAAAAQVEGQTPAAAEPQVLPPERPATQPAPEPTG